MESALPWDMLFRLTWPAALATIAFSPLGRGVGAWLQNLGGGSGNDNGGKNRRSSDRLAAAMERLAEAQDRQCEVMQQMQQSMAVLLDRTRGG